MDVSSATTMLSTSEEDVHMSNGEQTFNKSSHLNKGFMDPRVLLDGLDLPVSTESTTTSREKSEAASEAVVRTDLRPRLRNLPTGCCYDDRMKLHANSGIDDSPHHPEDPRRIEAIMTKFKENGIVYDGRQIDLVEILKTDPNRYMWRIGARKALKTEICTVHTNTHFEWVKSLSEKSSAELREMTINFDKGKTSLYVGNLTYQAALISVGGAIETCKSVVTGRVKNAIAIIRPPGHHAEYNESMGFCFFNNVAVAAKVCQADYPEICRRVLILDWDVHHGNGVQNIFYEDPNVLYISIHVYKNGDFYPGLSENEDSPDGSVKWCGAGPGEGKNINIGWTDQGMGDGDYMAAFQKIVMPVAHEFNPDLVIISAGFDAAVGDDLGGCFVTPPCYSQMTHMLMSLAAGKVAVCLEGGYNLPAISNSALAVSRTLMGEPPERLALDPINHEAAKTLDEVQRIQSRYWKCMRNNVVPYSELKKRGAKQMDVVIRRSQQEELANTCGMIPLYILRTKVNKVYTNQVLATPRLHDAKKILIIIHDPPDFQANADKTGNRPIATNSFVTDDVEDYTKWAVSEGFGVIDINIPYSLNEASDDKTAESEMQDQTREIMCYIWDNYLENTRASITLLGVGDAYMGIKQLLISRDARYRITGILSFVAGSLRPVRSDVDLDLAAWYKKGSLIYVSPEHACWSDENAIKKIRKARYGRIEKADIDVVGDENGVGKMLNQYRDVACEWMLKRVQQWELENVAEDPDYTDEDSLSGGCLVKGGVGQMLGAKKAVGSGIIDVEMA